MPKNKEITRRRKIGEAVKKMWQNPEIRKRIIEKNKGRVMSSEQKKKVMC